MSAPQDMLDQALQALQQAYAPYSHYSVAACLRAENDSLYSGCNVENAAYPLSQCAEACAIGNLIAAGQRRIKEVLIVVSSSKLCPPCGACRQRIFEFADDNILTHLCTTEGSYQQYTLGELLPHPFNSDNLERL